MVEVNPSNYIIGVTIFTLMILLGIDFIYEPAKISGNVSYIDTGKQGDFNKSFEQYAKLNSEVGNLKSNVENANTDFGIFGVLNSLINSAWQTLRVLISSFNFMDDAYNGLASLFGIPNYVGAILSTLVTIVIVFAIYKAIFKAEA